MDREGESNSGVIRKTECNKVMKNLDHMPISENSLKVLLREKIQSNEQGSEDNEEVFGH